MKRIIAILFATLILASGMHLSVAKHICGGRLVAVKWSVGGKKASCGMENGQSTCPSHNGIHSNCCKNQVSILYVDTNYKASSIKINHTLQKSLSSFIALPIMWGLSTPALFVPKSFINYANSVTLLANAVSLSRVCVFRI